MKWTTGIYVNHHHHEVHSMRDLVDDNLGNGDVIDKSD